MSRRSHNKTRRRNRGRFGLLFKLLCLVALVVAMTAGVTVFFRVESVVVTGNQRYTQEEIVAATGIQMGDNLFGLNKNQIDQRLRQSLPYIGDVLIRRSLPSTILITVTEWDAVAQIAAPDQAQIAAAQAELAETSGDDGTGGTAASGESGSGDTSGQSEERYVAQEPWLINVRGKLLEPAPEDSAALAVTGLTPLMPQAGRELAVPQSEQTRLEALLALLAALEEAEMLPQISSIQLTDVRVTMRYLDRFDVIMELNDDFRYDLQVIREVEGQIEENHGPDATGTMDLTQDQYGALLYSPG